MKLLSILLCVIGLAGCSLVPKETTKTTAIDQAASISAANNQTIRRTVEGPLPQPNVTVNSSGASNQVTLQLSPSTLAPSVRTYGAVPPLPGTVAPGNYREELEVGASSTQGGGTTEVVRKSEEVKTALWIKLVGTAIGILALVFALRYAYKSIRHTALGEALAVGDAKVKAWISESRSVAGKSTDPVVSLHAATDQAEMEAARGEMKAAVEKLK